jgi:hypothetical protein
MHRVKVTEIGGKEPLYLDLDRCGAIIRGAAKFGENAPETPCTLCYTDLVRPDGTPMTVYLVETPEEILGLPAIQRSDRQTLVAVNAVHEERKARAPAASRRGSFDTGDRGGPKGKTPAKKSARKTSRKAVKA